MSEPVPVTVEPTEIDVETGADTALVQRGEQSLLVDEVAGLENGVEVFERRRTLITRCRAAAILTTEPIDWVLSKDREGAEVALLADSGACKVAELYGINISITPYTDGRFEPVKTPREDGGYELRGWASGYSRFTGRHAPVEATILSTEDFTGRKIDERGRITTNPDAQAFEADLRSALMTRLRTKVVRVLSGLTHVSADEIRRVWEGTSKSTDRCRKGHGFGSSAERGAQQVTPAEVQKEAEELREEILRRVGGEESAAKDLLRDITKSKPDAKKQFDGFASTKQMTKPWQIENAWKRLKAHPHFGDAPQEETRDREPGED